MLLHFHSRGKSTFHERFLMGERENIRKPGHGFLQTPSVFFPSWHSWVSFYMLSWIYAMNTICWAPWQQISKDRDDLMDPDIGRERRRENKDVLQRLQNYKPATLEPYVPSSSAMYESTCWSNAPTCLNASCTHFG